MMDNAEIFDSELERVVGTRGGNYVDYVALAYFPNEMSPHKDIAQKLTWDEGSGELVVISYKPAYEEEHGCKSFLGYKEGIRRTIPPINLKNFEIYKDDKGYIFVKDSALQKFLPVEEYLKVINVCPKDRSLVMNALDLGAVRKTAAKPASVEIIERDGHLCLPAKGDIFVKQEMGQWLLDALKVTEDYGVLHVKEREFWNMCTPKQRTDIAAIIGIPLQNIIIKLNGLSILRSTMLSYGTTDAGKTWCYLTALRLWWGMILKDESLMSGDAISRSNYRFYYALDATNLPVFVDEMAPATETIIDAVKAMAMGAGTFRGTSEQKANPYKANGTLVGTAQSDIFSDVRALSDDLALNRRIYKNHYTQSDVKVAHSGYREFRDSIKEGGLIYEVLKRCTAQELLDAVIYYQNLCNEDSIMSGIMLGLAVMGRLDDNNTNIMAYESEQCNQITEAYELIQRDAARMMAGSIGEFKDTDAKNLETMMRIDGNSLFVNNAYLKWVNKKKDHTLNNRFKNLGEFKQFTVIFGKEWPPERIYDRTQNKRIGGQNGSFAHLPLDLECLTLSNISLTNCLTDIIVNKVNNNNNVIHVIQDINILGNLRTPHVKIQTESCLTPPVDDKSVRHVSSNKVLDTYSNAVLATEPQKDTQTLLENDKIKFQGIDQHNPIIMEEVLQIKRAAALLDTLNAPTQGIAAQPQESPTERKPAQSVASDAYPTPRAEPSNVTLTAQQPDSAPAQGSPLTNPVPPESGMMPTKEQLMDMIYQIIKANPQGFKAGDGTGNYMALYLALNTRTTLAAVNGAVRALEFNGDIYIPRSGVLKIVERDDDNIHA